LRVTAHHVNMAIHIAAGIAAVLAGTFALAAAKGGVRHRRAGRVFAWLGGIVVGSALVGVLVFRSFPGLSAATLAVGYQLISSLRTLDRRATGPAPIDRVLAVGALVACGWMLAGFGETGGWSPAVVYPTLGWLAAIALYDLSRPWWRAIWIARAWRLDHGIKMSNALFGMLSAGIGNLFPGLIPWSQVGPSSLGVVVAIVLVVRHWPRAAA
jgi:uncharacterized membrane protein